MSLFTTEFHGVTHGVSRCYFLLLYQQCYSVVKLLFSPLLPLSASPALRFLILLPFCLYSCLSLSTGILVIVIQNCQKPTPGPLRFALGRLSQEGNQGLLLSFYFCLLSLFTTEFHGVTHGVSRCCFLLLYQQCYSVVKLLFSPILPLSASPALRFLILLPFCLYSCLSLSTGILVIVIQNCQKPTPGPLRFALGRLSQEGNQGLLLSLKFKLPVHGTIVRSFFYIL